MAPQERPRPRPGEQRGRGQRPAAMGEPAVGGPAAG